jgi:hypothetical protein
VIDDETEGIMAINKLHHGAKLAPGTLIEMLQRFAQAAKTKMSAQVAERVTFTAGIRIPANLTYQQEFTTDVEFSVKCKSPLPGSARGRPAQIATVTWTADDMTIA